MTALRAIDASVLVKAAGDLPAIDAGRQPFLDWIAISSLFVDPTYQRDIGETGRRNIVKIAREFEWAKFATVIVTPSGRGKYVIIDGQHRTTAAALRGIEKVPCQIVTADGARQAMAFAAINANVTKMSPLQLHAARVAAGEPQAMALCKICEASGVTILRYPVPAENQKAGETMAVSALSAALKKYGESVLAAALACVTRTRDGHPGYLRHQMIIGLCLALNSKPVWHNHPRLLSVMEKIDLRAVFEEGWTRGRGGSSSGPIGTIFDRVIAHLRNELDGGKPSVDDVAKASAPTNSLPVKFTFYNGIGIDLAGNVSHNKRDLKVAPREALFISCLARGLGTPIDYSFLIWRVWARQAIPRDAGDMLDTMARSLAPRLAPLRLEIKSVKNVGIVLRAA